jgi:hypothetical protein
MAATGISAPVLGGTVSDVIATPRVQLPPATLEEARNQPGRREQIEQIARRIQAEGIKYVFFQQVSVSGHINGKGVVASFFPQVAEKGYQLVYGAVADLFTTRDDQYIGFGPEESELAAIAFHDPDGPAQLSKIGLNFLGGLLDHFRALMCLGNPTVNSYVRMWDTGFWAPIYRNWGWQNRTTTVRVASGGRFEYRGVDSSCNPYLTVAGLLKAGLDGIHNESDPGPPQQANTYDLLAAGEEIERVPDHLGDALDALAVDEVVRSALPGRLYKVFDQYKRDEWERYLATVTDWERNEYLEYLP